MKRVMRTLPWVAVLGCFFAWFFVPSSPAVAQEAFTNQDCLDCHSDQDLTKEGPGGKVIALFVDGEKFAQTIHGDMACTDCHSGIAELPHDEEMPLVDCSECHDDIVQEYKQGVHGVSRGNGEGDAPTCTSCHGDIHILAPLDDPLSPVHSKRLPETCGSCHSNPNLVAKYGIHVAQPIAAYRSSVHFRAIAQGLDGASCSDCHSAHTQLPPNDPRSTVNRLRVPDTCGSCHADITEVYKQSVHGTAMAGGIRDAPVCTDCHREHSILSPREPNSPVSATNLPVQTCGRCHGDLRLSEKYGLPLDKVPSYQASYHGLAARAGSQTVASCSSCHGVHDILPSTDRRSHIHPDNLSATCGQCHPGAGIRFGIGPVHVVDTEARFPILYYIRLFYVPVILFTIGGMLLHNLLDFIRKVRVPDVRAWAVPASEGSPERMMAGFRIAHALVVLSFPVLVYSGFALTYPEAWWAKPIVSIGPSVRGWVHRVAAVMLIGALFYHAIHVVRSRRARACALALMRPSIHDWRELKERMKYYLGLRKEPVPSPQVGYVEKSEYLAFWWGMLVMATTGLLLWFENFTLRWLPSWAPAAATSIHFYEAVLATLAILVWHFYWTIFDPAVYPMDMSWWTGKSPASRELERAPLHASTSASEAEGG